MTGLSRTRALPRLGRAMHVTFAELAWLSAWLLGGWNGETRHVGFDRSHGVFACCLRLKE